MVITTISVPTVNLKNQIPFSIPSFGYGTNSTETEKYGTVEQAVKWAIDAGYRYFDTSSLYLNEIEIGNAIREKISDGIITRNDICIVNKLCCTFSEPERVIEAAKESLRKLGIDYFDLYLMHIPTQYRYTGEEVLFPLYTEPKIRMSNVDYIETWQSIEQLVDLGLTKNVGVSNCNIEQLTRIISSAKLYAPAINHIECCPGLHQKELVQYCQNSNIIVTAYCPLGRPDFRVFAENYNMDKRIQEMCVKYRKTSSQLILRYLFQLGTVPIPKSITKKRIDQYIDIFDFELTKEDMQAIGSFYKEERSIVLENALGHPRFPISRNIRWKYSDKL